MPTPPFSQVPGFFDPIPVPALAAAGVSPVVGLAASQPLFVPMRGFTTPWANFGGAQAPAQVNLNSGVIQVRGRITRTGAPANGNIVDLPTGFNAGPTLQEAYSPAYLQDAATLAFSAITINPTAVAAAAPLPAFPGLQGTFNTGATGVFVLDINGQFKAAGSVGAAIYQRNAAASDDVAVLLPASAVAGGSLKVVFFFHGASDDYLSHISSPVSATSSQRLAANLINALLNDGWTIISSSGGSITDHWGNPASWTATQAALAWLRSKLPVSKITAIGQSMGGLSSLRALAYDPLGITNWAGVYPVCNLQSMYDGGTYTAAINTAYGGAPAFAAGVTVADPIQFPTALFAGKKMLAYASAGDTAVPKANNADALATKVSGVATMTVNATTGNHGDTSNWTTAIATAIVAHLNS